ncbi:hypothetical protein [Streptomyces sp. NRRL F-6491]|nr:hypothetical protein [Streptomyces sp. NRRL F-6491]
MGAAAASVALVIGGAVVYVRAGRRFARRH